MKPKLSMAEDGYSGLIPLSFQQQWWDNVQVSLVPYGDTATLAK